MSPLTTVIIIDTAYQLVVVRLQNVINLADSADFADRVDFVERAVFIG
jgi:hypothetical protein